jgi:tRNA threonylcarbamoyladenosine dehydratase
LSEACAIARAADDWQRRFGALARLYGADAAAHLPTLHVCVVGLGGVGSWAVEALARSGVGALTLIDYDTVCPTNANRQLHACSDAFGSKKGAVMAERVAQINPLCRAQVIDDYITMANVAEHLAPSCGYDYVIDAIDSIKFKAAIIYQCRRNKIPIITTGGAGGLTDPTAIRVRDLTRTEQDPLAAKVRAKLRTEYGYTKNPKRYFGVDCVFSTEQQVYPRPDGSVGPEKPGIHGISLDCRFGYGSASFVTGTFGFVAAAQVIKRTLAKQVRGTVSQEQGVEAEAAV